MRVIIFFDLPMESPQEKRDYIVFRKMLMQNGFIMMQKSVYCKLAINQNAADSILDIVRKNKPRQGNVQALTITEKQYAKIEYILGARSGDIIDSDERFIEV